MSSQRLCHLDLLLFRSARSIKEKGQSGLLFQCTNNIKIQLSVYVKYKTDIIENMHKKIEDMEFVLENQAEIDQKQDRLLSIFRLYTFINMLI